MNSTNVGTNSTNEEVKVNLKYFIQSAIQKDISWKALAIFLTDLVTTLDKSKEVIRILVQELEKWVSKVDENEIEIIEVPNSPPRIKDEVEVTNQNNTEGKIDNQQSGAGIKHEVTGTVGGKNQQSDLDGFKNVTQVKIENFYTFIGSKNDMIHAQ